MSLIKLISLSVILIILSIFTGSLFINTPVQAVVYNNDSRMLMDTGESSGGGGGGSTKILKNILENLFNGSNNPSPFNSDSGSSTSSESNDSSSATGINETFPDMPVVPAPDATGILNNNGITYSSSITSAAQNCVRNISIYKQIQTMSGVPWQILAGIHYREGGCNPNQSPVGGRVIGQPEPDVKSCSSQNAGLGVPKALKGGGCGFDNLLDATMYAAKHLEGKISKIPQTHAELEKALSDFNGGGNRNCRESVNVPYKGCPEPNYGDSVTYVNSKNPDGIHDTMYLIYCTDHIKCNPPRVFTGIGAIPIAGAIGQIAGGDL